MNHVIMPDSDRQDPLPGRPIVFLAGSIDEGRAERWQDEAIAALTDQEITILNPRRTDWDAALRQDIDEPRFTAQVDWELDGIERADIVLFHFSPAGPAPISLLELGKATALGKKVAISCPEGYWRRGNVQVVARRAGASFHDCLDSALQATRDLIKRFGAVTPEVDSVLRRALDASTTFVADPIMLDDASVTHAGRNGLQASCEKQTDDEKGS